MLVKKFQVFVNHFLQIGHYGFLEVHLQNGLMAGHIKLVLFSAFFSS